MSVRSPRAWSVVALALLVATACGSSSKNNDNPTIGGSSPAGATASTAALSGSITVLAASSLTDAFNQMGTQFKAAHPGVNVTFSFGGSATLAQQVNAGAPGDVLATADTDSMQTAVTAGNVSSPVTFAHNLLEIIVAKGNPKGIQSLADLAKPGLIVVLCAATQPCGKYGAQALSTAGVNVTPASLEPNVSGVVTKVTTGEADAGIVYVTDVKTAGDKAAGVTIPSNQNVQATYPIATLKQPQNPTLASAFVDFVRSAPGQAILSSYGFSP
jgi:molybdate transport system substrate-binding protein